MFQCSHPQKWSTSNEQILLEIIDFQLGTPSIRWSIFHTMCFFQNCKSINKQEHQTGQKEYGNQHPLFKKKQKQMQNTWSRLESLPGWWIIHPPKLRYPHEKGPFWKEHICSTNILEGQTVSCCISKAPAYLVVLHNRTGPGQTWGACEALYRWWLTQE